MWRLLIVLYYSYRDSDLGRGTLATIDWIPCATRRANYLKISGTLEAKIGRRSIVDTVVVVGRLQ
jgi:hypothetical protein